MRALSRALVVAAVALAVSRTALCQTAMVIDHTSTHVFEIPTNWITQAKQSLRIVYGHSSHGGQLTSGMLAMSGFMQTKGYPPDFFTWNYGGIGGALNLHDKPFLTVYDLGSPDRIAWEAGTRDYLVNHPECNVVIWSWCSQVSDATEADINLYLSLMDGLQRDYPNVKFVHMTGHLEGNGANGNLNIRNNQIRDHCKAKGEILYDFADIESYDPGGLTNYMPLLGLDSGWYDSNGDGLRDRNWMFDWQNSHTEGVDWFNCVVDHTEPIVGNLKAYAAWWLWARLAGWPGPGLATATRSTVDSKIETFKRNTATEQEVKNHIKQYMEGE